MIGTASAGKHEFLRGLGVDEVVDYRETDFAEVVRDVDVVLDTVGGEYRSRSLQDASAGRAAGVDPAVRVAGALPRRREGLGVRAIELLVEADQAGMRAIAELVAAGRLRATVAEVFPLAEAAKAHALGDTGRTVGKLVLQVR